MSYAKHMTYPFSEGYQKILVALAFREPRFAEEFGFALASSYFEVDEYKHLSRIALDYTASHCRTPDAEIANALVIDYCLRNRYPEEVRFRLLEKLDQLLKCDLSSADWVKERAIDFAKSQALRVAILKAAEALSKDAETVEYTKLVEDVSKAIELGTTSANTVVLEEVIELLPQFVRADSTMSMQVRIPTGISRLDEHMLGGIGKGQLGMVMGPPGRGKSHVLVQIGATAMRMGFGVHHITIQDLNQWETAVRYTSHITGVPSDEIMRGTVGNYTQRVAESIRDLKMKLAISYFPADTLTPGGLRSHISSVLARTGIQPDLIILDYADLMNSGHKPTFNSAEKSEMMGWLYLQLLKIADKFGSAVWTGSQVGMSHWEDEVITSNAVARSAKKVEHAHYLISLSQTVQEKERGQLRIYEAKFRQGQDGHTLPCRIDFRRSRIVFDENLDLLNRMQGDNPVPQEDIGRHQPEPGQPNNIMELLRGLKP